MALKQGAGRLIRRETDRGLLVVCDTRLATMGYGRRLLAALPPMRRLEDEASSTSAGLAAPPGSVSRRDFTRTCHQGVALLAAAAPDVLALFG